MAELMRQMTDNSDDGPPEAPEEYERRCPECERGVSWVDTVKFCPFHGKVVYDLPVLKCECGSRFPSSVADRPFCTSCGRDLREAE